MAEATESTLGTIVLKGDLDGSAQTPVLRATGVLPGTYNVANLVVNNKGLVIDAVEGDPEVLPCATTSACGLVVVGDNLTLNNGQISIPLADENTKGVVKVGSGFRLTGCVIDVDYPTATTTVRGLVKVPASGNIDVDGSGNISIPIATDSSLGLVKYSTDVGKLGEQDGELGLNLPIATDTVLGAVKVGGGFQMSGQFLDFVSAAPATESSVGVVQIGTGLDVDINGIVSVDSSEVVAENSTFGMIKSGQGISISGGSVSAVEATHADKGIFRLQNDTGLTEVSASYLGGYTNPSGSIFGMVKIGTNISVSGGEISIPNATDTANGVVSVPTGTGLMIIGGELSCSSSATSAKGVVSISSNQGFSVSSGVLSAPFASTSVKGLIEPGTLYINFDLNVLNFNISSGTSVYGIIKSADASNISITNGAVNVGSNVPKLNSTNLFTKSQYSSEDNLVWAANINMDASEGIVKLLNLDDDCTLSTIFNAVAGKQFYVIVTQDAVGGHELFFHPYFSFNNSTVNIDLSPNAITLISVLIVSSTKYATNIVTTFQ